MDDIWWRAETRSQAHWDEWGEHVTGYSYRVEWQKFRVIRTTPKGVWLADIFGQHHWVLGKAIRQVAQPTRELALRDETMRRLRHVKGCEQRLREAERLLDRVAEETRKYRTSD